MRKDTLTRSFEGVKVNYCFKHKQSGSFADIVAALKMIREELA
jgi:hypothetical protein